MGVEMVVAAVKRDWALSTGRRGLLLSLPFELVLIPAPLRCFPSIPQKAPLVGEGFSFPQVWTPQPSGPWLGGGEACWEL